MGPVELPAEAGAVPDGTHVIVTPPPRGADAMGLSAEDEALEQFELDAELLRRIREA